MGFFHDNEQVEVRGWVANRMMSAYEAVQRVRELHYRFDYPTMAQVGYQQLVIKDLCHHCGDSYPCKTIKALEGENNE